MKKESEQAYILLTIQASASVFLFVFSPISKKFGKKITYVLGMSILICVTFSIFYIDEQVSPFIIYFLGFLAGMGVATGLLIPWSMLPDAVDLDQLRTGYRREGDMYAIFGLFQKIGLGGAIAASSYALGLAGYVSPGQQDGKYPDDQPESVILTLKLIIGPIPACFLLLSFIPLYFYPITKEKHQEILRQLNKVDEVSY